MTESDELMQQLRSKASVLMLREEFDDSVTVYSQLISLCQDQLNKTHQSPDPKLKKSLCLALSSRAEARSRLREFSEALRDCEKALEIENTHFKSLLCKGKILTSLNMYAEAIECFRAAQLDPQNSDALSGYLANCRKMESLSRTGAFDISDWVSGKFQGKLPELAEYVGPVQVKKSEISGRGLFATKSVETGTVLFVTKAIAVKRSVSGGESFQLVMWKDFIDEVMDSLSKSPKISTLISTLSSGENEEQLDIPDMSLFSSSSNRHSTTEKLLVVDKNAILSALDVNSMVEDSVSSRVLGKNGGYYGIGLWALASFVNHSCLPNARRLHVGDYAIVHASRDIKSGEEIAFAYFDVLRPVGERREAMSSGWGFVCRCERCRSEEEGECREIGRGDGSGEEAVCRLEEGMRGLGRREKGYLRGSFWGAYEAYYGAEKLSCRGGGGGRGRRRPPPTVEAVVESVAEAVGSDERVVRVLVKKIGSSGGLEMEKAFKLGRGLYGKVMKKQALNTLLLDDVVS